MTASAKSALIVSPHQDDETLGCGGLIAAKREQQVSVSVLFVTDGGGCVIDESASEVQVEISAVRRQEALQALAILGVTAENVWFLNYPDSKLVGMSETEQAGIADEIEKILVSLGPEEVFVPFHHDGHPDHRVTHAIAKAAVAKSGMPAELWQYLVWALWDPNHLQQLRVGESANLHRLRLSEEQRRWKRSALNEYRSQVSGGTKHNVITLPKGFFRFFGSRYEYYLRASTEASGKVESTSMTRS